MQRAFSIQRNGTINHTRMTFYPVHDWSKHDVIDSMVHAGWKLFKLTERSCAWVLSEVVTWVRERIAASRETA